MISASEARQITEDNLKGPAIEPYITKILERIERFAKEGKSSIVHPFAGSEINPIPAIQRAVFRKLIELGFRVISHKDPDPGDPRSSGAYEEIKW